MAGKLFALVAFATVAGIGYCVLISQTYPFVLASEEARRSVEVTDSQRAELNAAKHSSDLIAYSIFGAMLCIVVAIVGSHPGSALHRLLSILVGGALGGIAGIGMGFIGYLFHDAMISVLADPMVHMFSRLSAMFLPVALAIGLTMAFASKSKETAVNATMGAVVGALLTSLLYGILSGLVTPLEIVGAIYPAHTENRYLLFLVAFLAIGIITFVQIARTAKSPVAESSGAV